MERDDLRARMEHVCTRLAISGAVSDPALLAAVRAIALELDARKSDRLEKERAGARRRSQRHRDKEKLSRDRHGDEGVTETGPPGDRTGDVTGTEPVTYGVTQRVTSRERPPSALPLSDQDPLSDQEDSFRSQERESSDARAQRHGSSREGDRDARDARETTEPRLERDDEPSSAPPKALHVQLREAWSRAAHGGLPAGSLSRELVFECCDVLTARGLGVDAFEAAASAWVEGKRLRGGKPAFEFFARDLAGLLDEQRAPRRLKGAPVPVSSAADFAAAGEDDFEAIKAAAARQGAARHG